MLLLSKEMTDKDRSMKTQLLFKPKDDKLSGERIWKEDDFFKDVRAELNLKNLIFFHRSLIEKKELINIRIIHHFLQLILLQSLLRASHHKMQSLDQIC